MSEALDRLTASISANQDATASVLALVTTIATEIRSNASDSDALNALADKLDSENQTIADAVVANTPAAPGATGGANPGTPAPGTPGNGTPSVDPSTGLPVPGTTPTPADGSAPLDAAGNPVSSSTGA